LSFRKSSPLVFFALLLLLPGSSYLWFDGIPWSGNLERLSLLLVLLLLVPRAGRERVVGLVQRNWVQRSGTTVLMVLLVAKMWSYFAFPLGGGFEVCLRSLYAPVQSCEKSYEATFITRDGVNALGSITRLDPAINYFAVDATRPDTDQDTGGSTWNLPFANDFPRLNDLWLDRLPFQADIGSRVHAATDSFLPIRLVGDLSVTYGKGVRGDLGTTVYTFSSYSKTELHHIEIPRGDGVLRLHYEFKEGPTGSIPDSPQIAQGPYATLQLFSLTEDPNQPTTTPLRAIPRDEPNSAIGILLASLNVALALAILGSLIYLLGVRSTVIASTLVGFGALFTQGVDATLGLLNPFGVVLIVGLTLATYGVTTNKRWVGRWNSAFSLSLGVAATLVQVSAQRVIGLNASIPWNHIVFRGRDTDWLVYQGYARQIFLEQSLRAGESTFYFVPGMRYIAFIQHLFLGESDMIIAVGTLSTLLAVTLLWFRSNTHGREFFTAMTLVAALLVTFLRPIVLELVISAAAEPITWLCLIVGLLPWRSQGQSSSVTLYTSVSFIAIAVFVRPNVLFAVVVLGVWILFAKPSQPYTATVISRALLLFVALLLLAFFHNLHYGESTTPFTTFVTLDRDLTIREILRSPFDAELRQTVTDKLRSALGWSRSGASFGTLVSSWVVQLLWFSALVEVLRRRAWKYLLPLLSPVIYLVSLLPFRYTNIPTRHFIALTLLMAVTSIAVQKHWSGLLKTKHDHSESTR
jgi:hypothetical protein